MKFLVALLLTACLAFLTGLWFPWWSLAPVALLAGWLIPQSGWRSFLAGFLALFLLWTGLALWLDQANQGILATKVAGLFPGPDSALFLAMVSGLIAGITGGLGALTGHFLRSRQRQ